MDEKTLNDIVQFARNPLNDMNFDLMRRPTDYQALQMSDMIKSIKSAPQVAAEHIQEAIRQHITGLQAGLKEDEQLFVYSTSGLEVIVVQNLAFPNWHTVILIGHDKDGNTASVIASASEIHLTCKVMKVEPPNKPYRVGFMQLDSKTCG
jgi:hypothetical protein